MNSRRRIVTPDGRMTYRTELHQRERIKSPLSANRCPLWVRSGHVRCKTFVCFTPNSDRESEFPQAVESALPPKAEMYRVSHWSDRLDEG